VRCKKCDRVDSVIYIDHSSRVAEATAVFERAEVHQRVDLKDWVMSKYIELYPGQYV